MDKVRRSKMRSHLIANALISLSLLWGSNAVAEFDHFKQATTLFDQENYAAAIKEFETAYELSPSYSVIQYYLAESHYRLKQFAKAITAASDYIEQLEQKNRQHHASNAYYLRGQAYLAVKQLPLAIADFEHAIQYANQPKRFRYDALIQTQKAAGTDVFTVVRTLDRAVVHFGPLSEYQDEAVDMLLASGEWRNAMKRIAHVLKIDHNNSQYIQKKQYVEEQFDRISTAY